MKLFHCSPSKLSIFCASSAVPSVQVTSAWVSPRVNTTDPWTRGSTPVSVQIGRISSNLRPSRRMPFSSASTFITCSCRSWNTWSASFFACASGFSPSEAIMSAFTLST